MKIRTWVRAALAVMTMTVAAAGWAQTEESKPTIIKPGKFAEKCMAVTAAQKLEYQFTTSKPVNFNIHFHVGDAVYYPVKREKTTAEADRFQPTKAKEDYCLMWENKTSEDVELKYSAKVIK